MLVPNGLEMMGLRWILVRRPICVTFVGSKRQVDFVNAGEADLGRTCLTLAPSDIMGPYGDFLLLMLGSCDTVF